MEGRRKFVHEKVRYGNRLTAYLKMYFPQVLDWFSAVGSPIVGDFLLRWPTLEKLQKARPDTLRKFFRQHNSGRSDSMERRIQEIREAVPATHDEAVIRSCSKAALSFARMLREIRAAIRSYDQDLETLTREHPDFALIDSLPGVGPALAPRLIAALGTQRDRYQSANELQCYCGIAPVLASSGKQNWVHWRWACPKFLRQTFQEWAVHSLASCAWGERLLPAATRQRQTWEHRRTSSCVQMDSHPLSVIGKAAHRTAKARICRGWNVTNDLVAKAPL